MSLDTNLVIVNDLIRKACLKSGRNENEVKIIAVTKYVGLEETKNILNLGLKHIGENRVQQGILKFEALHGEEKWHFIGNLQSRKAKEVVGKFDYIHSLDRLSLALEIDKRNNQEQTKIKALIQVNVSGEESKAGVSPDELIEFTKKVSKFNSIEIVGLMTMAPHYEKKELSRPIFRKLRELRDLINEQEILDHQITELSMGMSNDFEIAVEEGATFVRLGSILWNK